MNCRFCKVQMLPITDLPPDSDISVNHAMWECHNCPATVKSYSDDEDWFSILAFFNGHWYEVMQFYTDTGKEPPLLSIYKYTVEQIDKYNTNVQVILARELNINGKITPQNIKEKLATLLVFS